MENKNNQTKWKVIIRVIGTVLSILLMVYLFYTTGVEDVVGALKRISAKDLVLIIFLIFLSRIATFLRWHSLLRTENEQVHWKDSLRLTFAGLFAANFLPTTVGGDVIRLAGAIKLGVSAPLAAASLMTDRMVGLFGMALVLPLGLPALFRYMSQMVASTIFWSSFTTFTKKIIDFIKTTTHQIISNFRYWLKHPRSLLLALFFDGIHLITIFFIVQIIINNLGESLPFWEIAGIWSITYFITLIPVSINGLGLQEVTITNLYTFLGGISTSTSLSIAIIMRGLWVLASLPGAFYISGLLDQKKKKLEDDLNQEGSEL